MIWKSKLSNNCKAGDTREVNHFAWCVKLVGDQWLWLGWWVELQLYQETDYILKEGSKSYTITNGEWVTIKTKIL